MITERLNWKYDLSRVLLYESPSLRINSRITSFGSDASLLHISCVQAHIHFRMLYETTVAQFPFLIFRIVARPYDDRWTFGKFDNSQAEIIVFDLTLFGVGPFLIAARLVALVETYLQQQWKNGMH